MKNYSFELHESSPEYPDKAVRHERPESLWTGLPRDIDNCSRRVETPLPGTSIVVPHRDPTISRILHGYSWELSSIGLATGSVRYHRKVSHAQDFTSSLKPVSISYWAASILAGRVSLLSWTLWFRKPHDIKTLTPIVIILSFPLLLVGMIAVNLFPLVPLKSEMATEIALVGYLFQGMSSIFAGAYFFTYLQRVAITGHISGPSTSTIFIAVGPPALTAHVLIRLGRLAPIIFVESPNLLLTEGLGETFQGFGMLAGLMLTGTALLIYVKSMITFWWKGNKILDDVMGLWIIIFPNVGLVLAVRSLYELFGTPWLLFIQLFLSVVLITIYVTLGPLSFFSSLSKSPTKRQREATPPTDNDSSNRQPSPALASPTSQTSSSRSGKHGKFEVYPMDLFASPSLSRSNSVGGETLVGHAV
ncbi:uncharacterized protein MELLADRAFT_104284 [Melampsora larici-populina 98AG31]|uniref:Uncharacterized protein n=1 Tax=Melampsora larici-populina (strain 98AG31 / pathotype 3-4-7) TaxID=747676 RepID=F4RE75_MELLP|nr:uncharacterized protein MELLADRAFT_104284 [Melampsora larici-populina 98AG31]EGG09321.1 hypothetical protein MELLADRAFT_104284 [Melampsora larici-populina 98AG31]